MKKLTLILLTFFCMQNAWSDCPQSIEGATLFLSVDNEINLKITSSLACSAKTYLTQKFIDADVEVWRGKNQIGSFYARRVTYSEKTQMLILNQSLLTSKSGLKDATQYMIDLKNKNIISAGQFLHF